MKKKPDESPEDKAIGRAVAAQLRTQIVPAASGCPSTEMLAAFYDRTLTDQERAASENHMLTCSRCQEYLAELARLSDVDEPPVLEEAPETREPAPGWTFRLAWVLPFLILVAGIGLWFREDVKKLVENPREMARKGPEPETPSVAPKASPEQVAVEKKEAAKAPAPRQELARATTPEPQPKPPAEHPASTPAASALGGAVPKTGEANLAERRAAAEERAGQAASVRPILAKSSAPPRAKDAQAADRMAAAPPPAAEAQPGPASLTAAKAAPSELRGFTIHGAAQQFTPKWRVSRHGIIQRADEAGGWLNVPSGVDADLFDVTFAGPSAGWIVGHEGTVLRSTDGGKTWTQVSSPTGADLVRVSA